MTGLEDIRAALTTNLKSKIPDVQMTGYMLSQPTPPCFEVEPDPAGVQYDMAMGRGLDEWRLIVRGLVATGLDIGAQKTLDRWLAPTGDLSVKAAIESDRTLSGAADDLQVATVSNYRLFVSAASSNVVYLGAEWNVRIIASGK